MELTQKQCFVAYLKYFKAISDMAKKDGCFEVCKMQQSKARSILEFTFSTNIINAEQRRMLARWIHSWVTKKEESEYFQVLFPVKD